MKRDGACESIWQYGNSSYEAEVLLPENRTADVLIVGGGITGLTTALLLQKAGKKCIIAEANEIGFGTSGGTTAHINNFLETPFSSIIANFGEDNAKLVAEGLEEANNLIKKNIKEHSIQCDFEEKDAYLFSLNETQTEQLIKQVESSKKYIDVEFTDHSPFPIPFDRCAIFHNQAQFHPILYLQALANSFESRGGVIVQGCKVTNVEKNTRWHADTTMGSIEADYVVYATHIPPGVNILHFRCAPYRSYVLGVTLNSEYPSALGYDMEDNYHYYRTHVIDGVPYLIAGGEDHKTAHEKNPELCFRKLESHLKKYFDVDQVAFEWSSQYFESVDGLPYIGHLPGASANCYVATGYGGNGIILGTLSGLLLCSLIVNGSSRYEKVFNPARVKPVAGFSNFIKEAADVVGYFISGKFAIEKIENFVDIVPGEGKIVKFEGHSLAIYKDEKHNLHVLNPACTHIKCTVEWNSVEKSWDCPCHGSRFSIDGELLTGPARKDLEKISLYLPAI